jgi:RNA polymerase sigma-70 factor (ECF subfamily)
MMKVYETLSDAALIQASGRDPDAFRELYDRYSPRLHRFFVRRGAGSDAAVDMTAETFAQAWASRARFRDLAGGSAGPWLFIIARRVLMSSVARGRVERSMLERLQVEWSESTESTDARWLDDLGGDMAAALAGLSVAGRRALELRVLGGFTYRAIGRELGCTTTAARIRVSRSLARLRTQIEGSNT